MNAAEVHALLEKHGAVRQGHFRLSSGLHSDVYVQCAQILQWPGLAERLGHELGERFASEDVSAVLGPALGGIIIGHEAARKLGVRMIFSERVEGEMRLRRGFTLGSTDRVVVAEDVVSTGRSQLEAIDLARSAGAEVVGVGAIVDRSREVSLGARFEALTRLNVSQWAEAECPLCRRGQEVEAPGSRHLVR